MSTEDSREYQRQWRAQHREERAKYLRDYYAAHKTHIRAQQWEYQEAKRQQRKRN